MPLAPVLGMTNQTNRPGAQPFVAFEIALEVIRSLVPVVAKIRRHHRKTADQIVDAASSVAANLAEGNLRVGGDRLHFFRIAAGSVGETRAHLRVALSWGWIEDRDIEVVMPLLDREGRLTWGLTH